MPARSRSKNRPLTSSVDAGPGCILIAEDHENLRALLELVLGAQGHHILAAKNGGEALELSRSFAGPIDVLLSDVVMPGLSGPELARELQRHRPETAIILTSGYEDRDVARSEGVANPFTFIGKPFVLSEVVSQVATVLSEKRVANRALAVPLAAAQQKS